jgi:hypothetical protein
VRAFDGVVVEGVGFMGLGCAVVLGHACFLFSVPLG